MLARVVVSSAIVTSKSRSASENLFVLDGLLGWYHERQEAQVSLVRGKAFSLPLHSRAHPQIAGMYRARTQTKPPKK